jgi:hypothetical protein
LLHEAPEIYDLRGGTREFCYRPATQRLDVRDEEGVRVFVAQEEELAVGTAATAVLEVIADGATTMLTLLLPTVNFLGDSEQADGTRLAESDRDEPRRRSEQALLAVVQQAYVGGVSTRRVDRSVVTTGRAGGSRSA